ncbi:MAG: hypothetical protein ABJB93_11545, partial [Gaiellales bacterium]
EDILGDLRTAAQARVARRSTHRRRALLALPVVLLLTLAAAAAASRLGQPAPGIVKQRLAQVDQGMPADLRLDPDIAHARSVATDGVSTLYFAALRSGGYCLVIVTADGRERGTPCQSRRYGSQQAIDISLPSDEGGGSHAPVVLGGRVNVDGASRLELRYSDGASVDIPFAGGGFFIYDVPADRRAEAHGHSLELVAFDAGGARVASSVIPADWDGPAQLSAGPIRDVTTRSDSSDFTLVLGVDGLVDPNRVTTLELRWPDGSVSQVTVAPGGGFAYTFPASRVHDLAETVATLVAYGADGSVVDSETITSVAAKRAAG